MGKSVLDLDKREVLINLENGDILVKNDRVYLNIERETFIIPTKEYFAITPEAQTYRSSVIKYALAKKQSNFEKILFMQLWPALYPSPISSLERFFNSVNEDKNTPISIIYGKQIQDIFAIRYHTITRYKDGYFAMVSPIYEFILPGNHTIYLNFQEIPEVLANANNDEQIVKAIKDYVKRKR